MHICIVEAYASGSHLYFAKRLIEHLQHEYTWSSTLISLPGRHWRSRLQKSHILLAEQITSQFQNGRMSKPDIFILTSLTDTAAFRGLLPRDLVNIPIIQYMHENQMSYPLNEDNSAFELNRVLQKNVIPAHHLNQALGADKIIFNSTFHQKDFFKNLDIFLSDHGEREIRDSVQSLKETTQVIPIGLGWPKAPPPPFSKRPKRILWNHRWEYDKNPKEFSLLMTELLKKNPDWQLSLLGENKNSLSEFEKLRESFPTSICHFGAIENRELYFEALAQCRVLPVTSIHDFLGLATLEAILYGVIPLLPNRLVYPELIPQELHHRLLYQNDKDFHQKIEQLMAQGLDKKEESLLSEHLNSFKWDSIIPQWAHLIEARIDQINP